MPESGHLDGRNHLRHRPARCTECVGHFDEAQCVVVCPVECIDPDPAIPETHDQLLAKLMQLQRDHPELYEKEPPAP